MIFKNLFKKNKCNNHVIDWGKYKIAEINDICMVEQIGCLYCSTIASSITTHNNNKKETQWIWS